jgi:Rrf2 family nitric oxide-sensitive transcriptional repressor
LKTVRGKGGGLTLDKAPAEIRIGTLLRATEAGSAMVECMGEGGACRITAACALPKIFERATASFYAALDDYTLADLIANPEWLKALLTTGCSQALAPAGGDGTIVSNKRER